jgi:hypothetical protein
MQKIPEIPRFTTFQALKFTHSIPRRPIKINRSIELKVCFLKDPTQFGRFSAPVDIPSQHGWPRTSMRMAGERFALKRQTDTPRGDWPK